MCASGCFLFATFTAIVGLSVLISQLNQNLTLLRNQLWQLKREDIPSFSCADLCGKYYPTAVQDEVCCQSEESQGCRFRTECFSEFSIKKQLEINSLNMHLQYYMGAETVLFFVLLINTYSVCYGCRQRQARNAQRRQIIMGPALLQIQAIVHENQGDIQAKRKSILTQSFIQEGNEEMCAVCLQSFGEERVIKLKCKHLFHRSCIEEWMSSHETCPVCRANQ